MNSLEDPRIAAALDNLHRRAARDWIVFARALRAVTAAQHHGLAPRPLTGQELTFTLD